MSTTFKANCNKIAAKILLKAKHMDSFRQQKVVLGLAKRHAYPHKVSRVKIEETHISWIFLTGSYAYKVKKELKFGKVLDFSTLQSRKRLCQKEVILNKILCSEMYKGVAKIVRGHKDNDNTDNSYNTDDIRIVSLKHRAKALEYAVKMVEVPQKYRMDNLISIGQVNSKTIERLVETLIRFHQSTPTNAKIKSFGCPKSLKKKINENFDTLSKLAKVNPKFEKKLISFVKNNTDLFYQRIIEDKVRDIHGDLYLKNIFIVKNRFYLYDRIEFNDSLRYADVAEDIAHLSMDLDYHNRSYFRNYFISQYVAKSDDLNLEKIVYFWMCYKACVRAKVSFFNAKNEIVNEKKIGHIKESKALLNLANSYLEFL